MNERSDASNKFLIVAALVVVAFFASYGLAISKPRAGGGVTTAFNGPGATQVANPAAGGAGGCCSPGGSGAGAGGAAGAAAAGGGGCCGGSGSSTPIEKDTTVDGDVQKIAVDTSTGSFDPNTINAKAGVPIEITFSQAPGGCLSGVLFPDFGISEDLTGGGKTIKIPALEAGEYQFFCQMQMIAGKIVVK